MKKRYKWSYTTQIFLSTMLLITVPMLVCGVFIANKTVQDMNRSYLGSLSSLSSQVNLNIDSSLTVVKNIGVMHLLNDEVRRSLNNPYDVNSYEFALTYTAMKNSIAQAVQQNPNILQVIFIGRNEMVYDFGVQQLSDLRDTMDTIPGLEEAAMRHPQNLYYGQVWNSDYPAYYSKDILPVVQVLGDLQNSRKLGVVYVSFNFNAIRNITREAGGSAGNILLLDGDNRLFYQLEEGDPLADDPELLERLIQVAESSPGNTPGELISFASGGREYWVSVARNSTTGWKVVNYLDNSIIYTAYRENLRNFLVLFAVVMILAILLAYATSRTLTRAINRLCSSIDDVESGLATEFDVNDRFLNRELTKISESYARLNSRLLSSMEQNYLIRLSEKQMSLDMLRSQVNPHFLYNTLNLISAIANIHNVPEIRTITMLMSDLLRYNLKSGPVVRLKEEMAQIDRYVTIQQIRFPGRFTYECLIPQEYHSLEVPVFILQPLVENAVNHGLGEMEEGGLLQITCRSEGADLHIQVSDNGCGMTPAVHESLRAMLSGEAEAGPGPKDSLGIINVQQRIQAYYSPRYGLAVSSREGEGTDIDIRLPMGERPQLPRPD